MSILEKHLRDYLELRRGMGFELGRVESRLRSFVAFMETKRTRQITTMLALEFALRSDRSASVEVIQGAQFAKGRGFVAPGDGALVADVDFVLQNEFQELGVREAVGFGFLQTHLQAVKQPRETQGNS